MQLVQCVQLLDNYQPVFCLVVRGVTILRISLVRVEGGLSFAYFMVAVFSDKLANKILHEN